jgi:hypothetical protein
MVAKKLKDEGHQTITTDQLNQAVDHAMRRIQQTQLQQQQQPQQQPQAPPPYTPATQPSTTDTPGFSKAATAGPTPDPRYGQYRY